MDMSSMYETILLPDFTLELKKYKGNEAHVVIPDAIDGRPVSTIGSMCFVGCNGVETIHIPAGIANISLLLGGSLPMSPFCTLKGLEAITIDPANPAYTVVDGVLYTRDMTTLVHRPSMMPGDHLRVPDGVQTIAPAAFPRTMLSSLEFPDSVTTIHMYSFRSCPFLTTLTLPAGLTGMYSRFGDCPMLTEVRVNGTSSLFSQVDGVLFSKDMTTLICYPAGRKDPSYTIPQGVTTIGLNAFSHASSLVSVVFPDSVTVIQTFAFADCSGLTDLTLPASLTTIGLDAFTGCTGLRHVALPAGLTSIPANPFSDCYNLECISIASGPSDFVAIDGVLFNRTGKELVCYPAARPGDVYRIPAGITTIGGFAFKGVRSLTNLVIPEEVKDITPLALANQGFEARKDLLFTVVPGSAADRFCQENNLPLTYMNGPQDPPSRLN